MTWIELFYIKVGNAKMPIDEKDKNQVRTKTLQRSWNTKMASMVGCTILTLNRTSKK